MVVTNRASGCQVRVADCRLADLSTCAIPSHCFALMMAFAVLRFSTSWVCCKDEDRKRRVATKLKRLDGTSNGSLQALYTVSINPIICTCFACQGFWSTAPAGFWHGSLERCTGSLQTLAHREHWFNLVPASPLVRSEPVTEQHRLHF